MRELTAEQLFFLAEMNAPERIERERRRQEEERIATEKAQAEAEKRYAEQRAERERTLREKEETIRPLKEALKAAGIKLDFHSYEGVWGSYQIGDGPEVEFDDDSFYSEED